MMWMLFRSVKDIRLHRRVPFVGAMPKMHAAFKKRFHRDNGHIVLLLCVFSSASFILVCHLAKRHAQASREACEMGLMPGWA